jgi:hypothetical protein
MMPGITEFRARELNLGTLSVLRALPVAGRRLVGPWCSSIGSAR